MQKRETVTSPAHTAIDCASFGKILSVILSTRAQKRDLKLPFIEQKHSNGLEILCLGHFGLFHLPMRFPWLN